MDARSDIYSLGITFFQMLTGKVPFRSDISRDELFKKIRKGDLPEAKEIYPFVAEAAQQIINKATHIDKTKRYQTVKEFHNALKTAVL